MFLLLKALHNYVYKVERQVNNTVSWRKRISVFLNRLYLYPAPEPMPRTRLFWVAMGLVTLAILLFSGYYSVFLTTLHDAYLTHAEDLGIMDQAVWNTLHGQVLYQTICNKISDTNCFGPNGVSRFAIHFEPILFLISLSYLVAPGPKTLLIIQTVVVALGAYPAFWLTRLRLRNEFAGVAVAVLYLLYPHLQQEIVFDFHAVTLATSFFMFMLYFMYTRRALWTIVFAVLAIACKEELLAVVGVYGLWTIVFQRQWRVGIILLSLTIVWLGLWQLAVHLYANGHLLLASRWTYLGKGPVQIAKTLLSHPIGTIKTYVLEYEHLSYLRGLLVPAGFLPLLAPWILVLAAPTVILNLISSDERMYSGMFQYNAEIIPVLIFATIEALVVVLWLTQLLLRYWRVGQEKSETVRMEEGGVLAPVTQRQASFLYVVHAGLLIFLVLYIVGSTLRADYLRGSSMPFSVGFTWPSTNAHTALAQQFIAMIPPDASVSAQSSLVPHISERHKIYLFPYADDSADYIFLDVTSDIYPYFSTYFYVFEAKALLLNGRYSLVAAQDGYILMKKGLSSTAVSQYSLQTKDAAFTLPILPDQFCSYVAVPPQQVVHPTQVNFTGSNDSSTSMDLIGYEVNANSPGLSVPQPLSVSGNSLFVTTYWRVNTPITTPLQPVLMLTDTFGKEYYVSQDFPATFWCQTNAWKPGKVMKLVTRMVNLPYANTPGGLVHLSMALVPLMPISGKIMDVRYRLPLHVISSNGGVTATNGTNAVELMPLKIIP